MDNHQFQVAAELATSGLATVCEPEGISLDLLHRASGHRVTPTCHPPAFVLDEC